MKDVLFEIISNRELAPSVFRMDLKGDVSDITSPGQFINIKLEGLYLRRPISVFDVSKEGLSIIYKVVGKGTELLSCMQPGSMLWALSGLGNGYDTSVSGREPLLIGGGVGVPPLYYLAKSLISEGKKVTAVFGFNKAEEVFAEDDFRALGCNVIVATADGSYGEKGFASDVLPENYSYVYTCGPEPMLRAVYNRISGSGQFSFEERMGCGFGACMGCSCRTITGYKRICKDGPVLKKEEILWED